MIFTERTIRIVNGLCEIDNPIILYRGDFNVEIRFTIIDCPYKYTAKDASNVIETTNASYGQLVIKTPNGDPIFSDVTATNEGAVVFTITGDMIDETIELGDYDFQIRLFDSERTSRATICPVVSGIKVEEPIAIEGGSTVISDTNEVNVARANYAVTTTAAALEAFDSQGNYIETTWSDKMLITDARLNKIEDGITGVNQKIANINIPTVPTKTSQLTNDSDFATNASVDQKIAEASLGGGEGLDLSKLELSTENVDSGTKLIMTDGTTTKSAVIPVSDVTDEQLKSIMEGLIADGTLTALTIEDGSIDGEKTSFILPLREADSENLFDGTLKSGLTIIKSSSTGNYEVSIKSISTRGAIIPVEANTSYKLLVSGDVDKYVACFIDSEVPNNPDVLTIDTSDIITFAQDAEQEITSKESSIYLVLYLASSSNRAENINVNLTALSKTYSEYKLKDTVKVNADNIENKSITTDKIDDTVANLTLVENDSVITPECYTLGLSIQGNSIATNEDLRTLVFELEENCSYNIEISDTETYSRFRVGVCKGDYNWSNYEYGMIGTNDIGVSMTEMIVTNDVATSFSYDNSNNNYMLIYLSNTSTTPSLTITKTSSSKLTLLSVELLSKEQILNLLAEYPSNNITVDTCYKATNTLSSCAAITSMIDTDIYNLYDNLVAEFPNYVTKETLGQTATGLTMYLYKFMPLKATELAKRKKLFIGAGIHGGIERLNIWATYQFLKDLCENYKKNNYLKKIHQELDIYVIPIINPYGFNNGKRYNSNNVDLNRNHPTETWDSYVSNDKGASAGSELEIQYYHNVIDNGGFDMIIDMHNMGDQDYWDSEGYHNRLLWTPVFEDTNTQSKNLLTGNNYLVKMTDLINELFPDNILDKNYLYGDMLNSNDGTSYVGTPTIRQFAIENNMFVMTLEASQKVNVYSGSKKYDSTAVMVQTHALGNMILEGLEMF